MQVALKFVSSESRPRFVACMVRTAPRCKRHRGREIVLDAEQASVWRNRRAGRISEVDDGLLRTALYDAVHIILTTQGLFTTEELGDADRQARRHEQGQGGFACRLAVIMHRMLAERAPSTLRQSDRRRATVRAGHDTTPSRSEVPSPGRWITLGRTTRTRGVNGPTCRSHGYQLTSEGWERHSRRQSLVTAARVARPEASHGQTSIARADVIPGGH